MEYGELIYGLNLSIKFISLKTDMNIECRTNKLWVLTAKTTEKAQSIAEQKEGYSCSSASTASITTRS